MEKITLGYGSGGKLMHNLIDSLFMKELGNDILGEKKDSAILKIGNKEIAFATDSYVISPIFFPGGDIGSLAVYGTVNDLAVCGARPLYISLGLIMEEGFEKSALEKITRSMGKAARTSGVKVVTGDMKVVEKGSCDKIFINSSGIGEVYYRSLSEASIRPGDCIIINGSIGDHAISVLSKREELNFRIKTKSDSAPLNKLIYKTLSSRAGIKFMRDPTRGGVATTLNEIIKSGKFGIEVDEDKIPLSAGTKEACELLGLDPLYLACEGRVLIIAAEKDAHRILNIMRKDALGRGSRVIGNTTEGNKGKVLLKTVTGSKRILDMLTGEQLPRIC